MEKLFAILLLTFSIISYGADVTSDYKSVGKIQIQGATNDVYMYLDNAEEWVAGCNIAYIPTTQDADKKLYSAILAAKMAEKKIALVGDCRNGYFWGNQLFLE